MMNFNELNPELQEKAKTCNTPEELLELAKETGYELTDEEMEAVAGGRKWGEPCNDWICGVIGH